MHFQYSQKVLFKHCDPAGIVFYPRFFEMINAAVEALFNELLDWPFEAIHPDQGVPTAAIDVKFKAPCFLGDQLDLQITIKSMGGSSLSFNTQAIADGDLRFEAEQTLVFVGEDRRPQKWPEDIRSKIYGIMEINS